MEPISKMQSHQRTQRPEVVAASSTEGTPEGDATAAVAGDMEAASNRHVPGLFLFYSLASGTTSYLALQHVQPDVVLLLDCTFWLGVVASVSLMEAWVKVRLPLILYPRDGMACVCAQPHAH